MTVLHQTPLTSQRGRWRRELRAGRARYYAYVGPFRTRIPWFAWAMFS